MPLASSNTVEGQSTEDPQVKARAAELRWPHPCRDRRLVVSLEEWSGNSHQQPHRDILAKGHSAQRAAIPSSCLSCSGEATSESQCGRGGANQQAGRLLTSFRPLTLALNSTDLISWWWERPGMNSHLVLCSGNVNKSHQSLFCLPKVYGVHLKKKTPWAPDITSLFGGWGVPPQTQRL